MISDQNISRIVKDSKVCPIPAHEKSQEDPSDGVVYTAHGHLSFLHRLRPEIRWPNPEALREQIGRDVAKAKRYFALCQSVTPSAKGAIYTSPGRSPG